MTTLVEADFDDSNKSSMINSFRGLVGQLSPIDGSLLIDLESRNEMSGDFGNIIHHTPSAVLKPKSTEDIVKIIHFAREYGLKVSPRGMGHTGFGQSQVERGIVIDMGALKSPPIVMDNQVIVDSGMTWREVLRATLADGLRPPVLTHNLGLSVGGTLSVGGIDSGSYRFGAQVDHVLEMVVVTGEGKIVKCSTSNQADLFTAVLAGLGQCAVITSATLQLVPAPSHGRLFRLFYPNFNTLIGDLRQLFSDQRFDRFYTNIFRTQIGGWLYFIDAAAFYTPPTLPDDSELLNGLAFTSRSESTHDLTFEKIADRVPLLQSLHADGRINLPHPWFDIFLPDSNIEQYIAEIFRFLKPADIGSDFPISLSPINTALSTRPLFRLPDERLAFLLDLQSTAPNLEIANRMVSRNRQLYERARELGGILYPIGATPLSKSDWKIHFHPYWERFADAKMRYDPDNILTPGVGIFQRDGSI